MLGMIIGIEEDTVLVKLNVELGNFQNIVNLHVVMEDETGLFVGEVSDIKEGIAYIKLLGEIVNNKFVAGVIKKPSFAASVKLISKEKIPMIISVDDYQEKKDLYIGTSSVYDGVKIALNINQFFSNHFCIFGSTGSGKSWGTAHLIQSVFDKKNTVAYRASLFIFDAYGEYHSAFKDIGKMTPEISFKAYTTNTNFSDTEVLKIPLWLLDIDDFALLLSAEKATQLPIIEKTLKLVNVFAREEEGVIKQKNDIIARAILDILSSGKPSSQIRDQIFSILSNYKTNDLNLESVIYQPGYERSLKQCLIIDNTGKIREMELITKYMQSYLDDTLELTMPDGSFKFGLDDLSLALDFALISEGSLNSERVYDEANVLKVRLHTLMNSDYAVYFDCKEYISKDDYIKGLLTAPNGRKAQIINFNINYVDDRFAKNVTKIYSRILFEYAKNMEKRGSLPFHIILEEAHRYVQNDSDINIIGYNIFDRIAKEGRKYGVLLGLISQRPSDLSETSISQCSNFLIFKMLHPRDITYIKDMVPNVTNEIVKRFRILQPGNCVGFGSAFNVPVMVKLDKPSPPPSSSSVDISSNWFIDRNVKSDEKTSNGLFADTNRPGRVIYKGASPKNYLSFNNEIWRILARETDGTYKIVRGGSIGNLAYDNNNDNDWSKPASINSYLNNQYYNSLSEEAKSKIADYNFNVGMVGDTANDLLSTLKEEEAKTWKGKVGLMTVSDYIGADNNGENYITSSILPTAMNNCIWLLSPYTNGAGFVWGVGKGGNISSVFTNNVNYGAVPVVYLVSGVKFLGSGTEEDPYRIA